MLTAERVPVGERRRTKLRGRYTTRALQTLVSAFILGILLNWGGQFGGFLVGSGYRAGNGDHEVLSPLGMHWADPNAFAGDWFLNAAPQPHWFFDIVTYFGRSIGALEAVYLAYWALALILFGLATALLAERWAPRRSWLACVAISVVAALSPWLVAGTGSGMISQAIPAVLGGQAAYLFVALVITGRERAAAVLGPVIAAVHVQQGAVVTVLLAVLTVMLSLKQRRLRPELLAAGMVAAAIVAFGLLLRPIAAHPGDFAWVCDELISYHCASDTWGAWTFYGSTAMILAACLTVVYTLRSERPLWLGSLGLIAVGLLGGMFADRLNIPILGELAQSVNVYRLGACLVPFALWGILLPLLRSVRFTHAVSTVFFLIVWITIARVSLGVPHWQLHAHTATMVIFTILVLIIQFVPIVRGREMLAQGLGFLAILGLLIASFVGGFLVVRPLDPSFIPNADLRQWGHEAQALIPAAEQVIVPPRVGGAVRLATERGTLVDCKNIPYGGEALDQWRERLDALGGWSAQCLSKDESASARELEDAAERFDMDYIILDTGDPTSSTPAEMRRFGWTMILPPSPEMPLALLEKQR